MKNYSEMAEQTLLGSLFFNNAAIGKVETILNEEHFYVPVYGAMFKAMQTQWQQTAMLSGHKVMQEVRQHPACQSMDELQFNAWAAEILQAGNGTDDLMATASYIVELYNKRYLLQLNAELAMALESGDVAKIEGAKQKIEKATLSTKAKKRQTTEEQIREAFATLQAPDNIMPTGFKIWDDIFGGIAKNARYIIAAHSGAGKTAMAMNIAANIAQRGKKVHFFLFEETKGRLWARIAAMTQMTNMASFRNPAQGLEPAAHDAFIKLFEEFKDKNILFHDNVQSVAEMIDLCGECDLIVIDGMSSFPAPAEFTKVDKAGWVSDQCVKLSKHTGAGVLILSHVNSDAVKAGPSLAGLYGGQAATFDPEGILEIRRDSEESFGPNKLIHGLVLKNRYGEVGQRIKMMFDGSKMKFYDYAG